MIATRNAIPTKCFFIAALMVVSAGCNEEIRLVNPGDPIPVVYGILDHNDARHNILIYKSFSGEEAAAELVQKPELLYYDDAQVSLRNRQSAIGTFHLSDQHPRDPGFFPVSPHPVYTYTGLLQQNDYLIDISISPEAEPISVPVTMLEDFTVYAPYPGSKTFYFYEDPLLFSWLPPAGAGLFEIELILTYRTFMEGIDSADSTFRHAFILFPFEMEWEGKRCLYRFYSDRFFSHLGRSLGDLSGDSYRKPVNFTVHISCGDEALGKYLDWEAQEIDGQANPNGNIPGGIGILASKSTWKQANMKLSGRSMDSLRTGRFTRSLDFTNNSDW